MTRHRISFLVPRITLGALLCFGGCMESPETTGTVEQFTYKGDLGRRLGSSLGTGTTQGLTNDYQLTCGTVGPTPDAAYIWTAPAAGSYLFSTSGSSFDTILEVLQYNTHVSLGCNDDSNVTLQSEVTVNLAANQTVVIIVEGYGGAVGPYQLSIGKGGTLPFGNIAWFRADDGATGAELNAVSFWNDQHTEFVSDKIAASMPVVARRPRYVYDALNRWPVLQFNGAQSMDLGTDPGLGLNRFTLFIVARNRLTQGFNMILGPDDLQDNSQVRWENPTQVTFLGIQSGMPITTCTIGNTLVYHALSASYDGSTMIIYRDGAPKCAVFFGLAMPWRLTSVASYKSSFFMTGDVAEIIAYERALTETERLAVNAYLSTKYGLP